MPRSDARATSCAMLRSAVRECAGAAAPRRTDARRRVRGSWRAAGSRRARRASSPRRSGRTVVLDALLPVARMAPVPVIRVRWPVRSRRRRPPSVIVAAPDLRRRRSVLQAQSRMSCTHSSSPARMLWTAWCPRTPSTGILQPDRAPAGGIVEPDIGRVKARMRVRATGRSDDDLPLLGEGAAEAAGTGTGTPVGGVGREEPCAPQVGMPFSSSPSL